MLFGVPDDGGKTADGGIATDPSGLIPQAVRALKKRFGAELLVGTDVCLCGYTDHGHCGVLRGTQVDNDASLPQLAAMALAHAQAGADIVAPSDMMDGRVAAIRHALNENGCADTILLAYSAKYASGYYGPFREAAHSAPSQGDRQSYQMDSRNSREARREIALDIAEGADMVMVKPALAYLDIIAQARSDTHLPVACYNVSGEYAMVKAAALNGWIDEARVVRENLIAMRRAGADLILTYHARDALRNGWL
jgi:porphobilinogen synthase